MLWLGRWRCSARPEGAALSSVYSGSAPGDLCGERDTSPLESWRNRASPLGVGGVEAGRGESCLSPCHFQQFSWSCVEQDLNQNAGRVSVTRISTPGPRVRVVRYRFMSCSLGDSCSVWQGRAAETWAQSSVPLPFGRCWTMPVPRGRPCVSIPPPARP